MTTHRFFWPVLFVALLPVRSLAADTLVNTCGQVVDGNGFLAADLDCTGFGADAVTLTGGTLNLSGFTLTGGLENGVTCIDSCAVKSNPAGGTITGSTGDGIELRTTFGLVLTVDGVTVSNNGVYGIEGPSLGTVKVFNSTVSGNGMTGLFAHARRTFLSDSTVVNNGENGLFNGTGSTNSTTVRNSTVSNNGWGGIGGGNIKVQDSEVLNNGVTLATYGIDAGGKLRLIRSRVEGNVGAGAVGSDSASIRDSLVLGNNGVGVEGGLKLKVKRSTVSGNTGNGCEATRKAILIDATVTDNGGSGAFALGYVKAVRSTLNGNLRGVYVDSRVNKIGKILLKETTVMGNTRDGVFADDGIETVAIKAIRSNVNGNGTDAACNVSSVVCADIVAGTEVPRFDLVPGTYECGTSFVAGTGYLPCGDCPPGLFPGLSFGVCLQDCQNSTLNGAEVCDDGGFSATCDNNCTPQACGDLTTNPAAGEECDDGNADPNDACKNDCSLNVCGDGVIRTGVEQCDDGNTNSGDGCSSTCRNEP